MIYLRVKEHRQLNSPHAALYCSVMAAAARRPKDDVWSPDAFDATAVELMRNLINRAKQPGHLYPMAMFSYPVMPPPKTVDKALGERRLTAWSGVGISVCEELDWQAVINGEQRGGCHRTQVVRYAALTFARYAAFAGMYSVACS
jgi:glycerol-3-phosphate O-acyltransferase